MLFLPFPTGLNRICRSVFAFLKGRPKSTTDIGNSGPHKEETGGPRRLSEALGLHILSSKKLYGKKNNQVKLQIKYLFLSHSSYKTSFMLNRGEYSFPAGNLKTMETIYLYASSHLAHLHQNTHSWLFKLVLRQTKYNQLDEIYASGFNDLMKLFPTYISKWQSITN